MKRLLVLAAVFVVVTMLGGCIDGILSRGAMQDLYTAASITDQDLKNMSRKMRDMGDKQNKVAPADSKYGARLIRLTNRFRREDGLTLNFKVYLTSDINANATADGSIRVYSGLMDLMTDNELLFVIGHEIGHVKNNDSLDKVRMAYASSGALKAAAASGVTGAQALSNADLQGLLRTVLNAQFSQSQESSSDAYGYNLMKKYEIDVKAAVSALEKLNRLGSSGNVMSSHPSSDDRVRAIQAMIERDSKK